MIRYDTSACGRRGIIGEFALACLAVGLLLSAGCKVGPDYRRPAAPVVDGWQDAGAETFTATADENHRWWSSFKDPTLDALIEKAYKQNLDLQSAAFRVLAARARAGIARGEFWPQIQEGRGEWSRVNTSERIGNPPPVDNFNAFSLGADVAWELDVWGLFRRSIESADAGVDASIATYDDVMVSLIGDVAATYVQLRTFQERLKYIQNNVDIQARSLKLAKVRFDNGAVTELDVQQATGVLANTQAQAPALTALIRQAKNRLCILLGMPPQDIEKLLGGNKAIPAAPPTVLVGVPAELLRRRPDIRRAEREAAAQSAIIGVAKADLFPHFSLLGTIGLEADQFGEMWDGGAAAGAIGSGFRWKILNYGRVMNNVRAQDASFQALVARYQQTVLRAAEEVENAMIGYLKATERVGYLTTSVQAALRSVQLSNIQYKDGAVDYTRVLDSQEALVRVQDELTATRGEVAINLVRLYRALGGGWQIRGDTDPTAVAATEDDKE